MRSETDFEYITTEEAVEAYTSSRPIFVGILKELRELSKKKPEATMSASKVKIVNRVLGDLLPFLKDEPTGRYLDQLDDEALPQISDAVLMMVQFESALAAFSSKYMRLVGDDVRWITEDLVAEWEESHEEETDGG